MTPPASIVLLAGALGDTALTLPMLHALPTRYPGEVLAVCRPEYVPLLSAAAFPLQVCDYERTAWRTLFLNDLAGMDPHVRSQIVEAECVVNLLDTTGGAVQRNLSALRRAAVIDLPNRPPSYWQQSVAQYYLTAVAAHRVSLAEPLLQVGRWAREAGRLRLEQQAKSDGHITLIHPGSGGLKKCWPIDKFVALAERLSDADITPLFLVGPDELEQLGPRLLFQLQRVATVVGPLKLAEVLPLVATADLYIGNDAGMTHVAGLLGVATIALFGPTNPRLWRPLGPSVRVVAHEPIDRLAVDEVISAVWDVLDFSRAVG